jgi:Tol biopolymer transport system component
MNRATNRLLATLSLGLAPGIAAAQSNSIESRATGGTQANGASTLNFTGNSMSADGRTIAFGSYATNLTTTDNNGNIDVFLRDRVADVTTCCSLTSGGKTGNNYSQYPTLTADGRYVAFESLASDLVANDHNACSDVFVYDASTGALARVSVTSNGAEANSPSHTASISADGRYVVFTSLATNLSASDTNNKADVYVRDLVLGTTTLVSTDASGTVGNNTSWDASISDDGGLVAFRSLATNFGATDTGAFYDVFLKDVVTGAIVRVSSKPGGAEADNESFQARVCGDGSKVFYTTLATDILTPDANGSSADVLAYDVATGVTSRVDVSTAGKQTLRPAGTPSPSTDGRYCSFQCDDTNLDPILNAAGGYTHIFVRDLVQGRCVAQTLTSSFATANDNSFVSSITGNGRQLAFLSMATNLDPTDANSSTIDVFFRDCSEVRFVEFGVGLAGSGGVDPHLFGKDGRESLGDFAIEIEDGLGGAAGFLWVGTQSADYFPVFGGHFYVSFGAPWTYLPIALGGSTGVAAAGSHELPGLDLSAFDGLTLTLQVTLLDPAASHGVALTNGLEMNIGD